MCWLVSQVWVCIVCMIREGGMAPSPFSYIEKDASGLLLVALVPLLASPHQFARLI